VTSTPSESGAVAPETDPWIGRILDDRYRIEEFLAEGGMGSVYIAEHLKLHKAVALKVIHQELVGDGEVAARFAREAMASAQLDHPHVASALDYGALPEGGAYLVMQLVRGDSIAELIEKEGAVPWPKACEVAAQVADALAAAHAADIVHRDLKPDNVLLEPREDGSVLAKVLDFGIARVTTEGKKTVEGAAPGKALTRVGTVMGTPGYMAPEQAMGDNVDHRADLYALGVCLWELLVGKTLYDTRDLTQIVTRQLTETPQTPREATGDASIPEELDELVMALLSHKPDDRPGSASVIRDLLRQMSIRASITGIRPALGPEGEESKRREGTAPTMLADSQASPRVTTENLTTASPELPVPPKVLGLGCAALAALGLVVVVGIAALSGDDETAETSKPTNAQTTGQGGFMGGLLDPVEEPVPPEVLEQIDEMQHGRRLRDRRRAARRLIRWDPRDDVPEWALATARIVDSRRCEDKKAELEHLVDLDASEALPTLLRMHHAPPNQCGPFFRRTDCFGCMRAELRAAIEELGGDPDAPPDEG
jgi:serine/threonine-protein kinase